MKIALIQTEIKDYDINLNYQYINLLLDKINKEVDLIILPEMFLTGFVADISLAKESKEKGLELMKKFATKHNIAIEGSLLVEENGKYYNRHYFVEKDKMEYYDKVHLFSFSEEKKLLTKGEKKDVIVSYKGWKIKMLTCYDLRFASMSMNTYKNEVLYDVLIYVASWPESRKEQWQKLLMARAIENQAYVIGVNRKGKDDIGTNYSGDSCIINCKGEILEEENNFEKIIHYYEINKDSLEYQRKRFPVYLDW